MNAAKFNLQRVRGVILTGWMVTFGLKRRWYEFDFLARRRLAKHLKKIGCVVSASMFNKLYPVGGMFIHVASPAMRSGGPVVRTVAPARDFKCGGMVEINREPYFVKVETLRKIG